MAYNLQGIVRKASTNLTVEFDRLAYATQNFANVNTNGYKAVRFEDVIDADGSVHGVERVDTKTGDYLITNNPLDIALQGAGYIPVTTPQFLYHIYDLNSKPYAIFPLKFHHESVYRSFQQSILFYLLAVDIMQFHNQ